MMTKAPSDQIKKFRDLARELESDESAASFDEKLSKIARTKPTPERPVSKRSEKKPGV